MPLLANDPHLGIQMPSIWYEVGLHYDPEQGEDEPYVLLVRKTRHGPIVTDHGDMIDAAGFGINPKKTFTQTGIISGFKLQHSVNHCFIPGKAFLALSSYIRRS